MGDINIAIDGHSSCGKSTLAKDLARHLCYKYIDSGAMYRAVALYFLNHNISPDDHEQVGTSLDKINITIEYPDGQFQIFLNGEEVTERIKQMDVSSIVSEVAAVSVIRKKLVQLQQEYGHDKKVVMDGRDIGTVVFPKAELKLFVTASLEVRTERRYQELKNKGLEVDKQQVKENLLHRDHIDSTRLDSPLAQAEDAILIDNSRMNRNQQLQLAIELAEQKIKSL